MALKIPPILKDRKVQIGVAGAAALGLFALYRKQNSAAAGGVDSGTGTTPQSISPAVMDSSGTDVYNAIQSLGQGWQADLQQYTGQLNSFGTQIAANTTAIGKLGTTKAPGSTVKPPVAKKPLYIPIASTGWASSIGGIAQRSGVKAATLLKLNPQLKGNVHNITPGETIRYR